MYRIASGYGSKISVFTLVNTVIYDYCSPVPLCTYQCKAGEGGGGEGRAWGGDLIVFVGPGVGHLTDLVLLGEGTLNLSSSDVGLIDCRLGRKRL